MKKYKLLVVVLLLGLAVFIIKGPIKFWSTTTKNRLTQIKRVDFTKKIIVPGMIVPAREAVITAPYSGYIKRLYVHVGQHVKAKDPIVTLEETLDSEEKTYPIRSPYSGTVVLTQKSVGDFVKEGDTSNFIAKINDLSTLYVNTEVPETDIAEIKVGQKAQIKIVPVLNKIYNGTVYSVAISPRGRYISIGSTHATYPVKIKITNKDTRLRPGMSAVVDIIVSQKKIISILPHEFVGEEEENYYVILADGKRQTVTTGIQNDQGIEILTGLKKGEQVRQIDYLKSTEID